MLRNLWSTSKAGKLFKKELLKWSALVYAFLVKQNANTDANCTQKYFNTDDFTCEWTNFFPGVKRPIFHGWDAILEYLTLWERCVMVTTLSRFNDRSATLFFKRCSFRGRWHSGIVYHQLHSCKLLILRLLVTNMVIMLIWKSVLLAQLLDLQLKVT